MGVKTHRLKTSALGLDYLHPGLFKVPENLLNIVSIYKVDSPLGVQ